MTIINTFDLKREIEQYNILNHQALVRNRANNTIHGKSISTLRTISLKIKDTLMNFKYWIISICSILILVGFIGLILRCVPLSKVKFKRNRKTNIENTTQKDVESENQDRLLTEELMRIYGVDKIEEA